MSADETQPHRRRPAGADEGPQCSRDADQTKSYDSTQPLVTTTAVEKIELPSPSPDNTYSHLSRKPLLWRFREGVNKWWVWEATAAIISTACLVAVMALLAFINGKPLSYWRFSMMPNAVVTAKGWSHEPHWDITECRFSFCAKVYMNVRMINGTVSSDNPENVPLEAVPNSPCWKTKAPPPTKLYDIKGPACMEFTNAPNTVLPSGANSTFLVQYAGRADAALLGPLLQFDAKFIMEYRHAANGMEWKRVSDTVKLHGSNPAFNVIGGMEHRGDNISSVMHRIAQSMTNHVRTSSDVSGKTYGTAMHMETFIVVRWKWLGLPVAVIVFGVAFLVATIALNWTKKTVLWKSNDLPLLTHGLQGWDAGELAGAETSVAIRRTAGKMNARLGRNGDGELRFLRA